MARHLKILLVSALKFLLYIAAMLLTVLIVRLLFFNFYVVPSDSMEPAIQSGDFIAVNKSVYGARIFTNLKFDSHSDPLIVRAYGFGRIKRNDILVFNFPRHKGDTIRMHLEKVYVKRCIGLPGDSVSAINGLYYVAGFKDTLGFVSEQKKLAKQNSAFTSPAFQALAFPKSFRWNIINFGPFYVPAAGETVELAPKNIELYRKQLVYETKSFIHRNDSTYIDGIPATHYTFRSNWYFVAGDKVVYSQDSRHFGLIPEAYIIGKVGRVMWSKDIKTGQVRRDRTMKKIR
jgi:signal peptidase I